MSAVLNSLTLMLYLLVPWTALNLVDFFFVRRGHYAITDIFRPNGVYGAWGWRGLTAYFVGFAAEIPFMVLPPIAGLSYTGYFPAHLTNGVDYSWLVGLVVSGLVYLLLSRSSTWPPSRSPSTPASGNCRRSTWSRRPRPSPSRAILRAGPGMGNDMTEPVPRIIAGDTVGPVDATAYPATAGRPRSPGCRASTKCRTPMSPCWACLLTAGSATGRVPASARPTSGNHPACSGPTTRPCRYRCSPASRSPTREIWRSTRSASTRRSAPSSGRAALLERARFVLTLGGDHTVALPMLRALSAVHGPVAVVHFDAHLDTWDTYFGAAYTHGTPFRRASEEGLLDRTGCLHVGIRGPLYTGGDLSQDTELGFQVISAPDVDHLGVTGMVERIHQRVGDRPVYVSVDIDVLDPAHAPGTGTPEAGGLSSRELLATLRSFARLNLVGADIVEVAPAYDHAQITGIAAAHVGYELLSALAARKAAS